MLRSIRSANILLAFGLELAMRRPRRGRAG
jgi:hypothetical protein